MAGFTNLKKMALFTVSRLDSGKWATTTEYRMWQTVRSWRGRLGRELRMVV